MPTLFEISDDMRALDELLFEAGGEALGPVELLRQHSESRDDQQQTGTGDTRQGQRDAGDDECGPEDRDHDHAGRPFEEAVEA